MNNRGNRSFREMLRDFMWDRNGFDSLCRAVWILSFVLCIVNIFADSLVISIIITVLVAYTFFRILSKNLERRRAENAVYHRIAAKIKKRFSMLGNRWRDRKTHVYRKCPQCGNTLRFPKMRGTHVACCPCCHRKFDVKIR